MRDLIYMVISAGLGSLGFALFYNIKPSRLWAAVINSLLTTTVYLLVKHLTDNLLVINIVSAIFATIYAEILARILKSPATVFLIPGIIPLVPGGYLYYTMYSIVINDTYAVKENANATLITSLGIAIGIVVVSVIMSFKNKLFKSVSAVSPPHY